MVADGGVVSYIIQGMHNLITVVSECESDKIEALMRAACQI